MGVDKTNSAVLPKQYSMSQFPATIEFVIPDFKRNYSPGSDKSLALRDRDSEWWFHEFVDRVIAACGHKFLPICRMSDGEFLFLLGEQPPDVRLTLVQKLRFWLSQFKWRVLLRGGLGPHTVGHYHSGEYSNTEWRLARKEYPEVIRELCKQGILAWHLNFTNVPFQERYFPALERWMNEEKILIHDANYYPFYFVYAMLTGPRRVELLSGRRLLVVNGAQGDKKQKIIEGLKREGVVDVLWCPISLKRSLYDTLDLAPYIGKVDLAVVGAGIGKANILTQMKPLNIPCIDAGFVFEVWADPENKWKRVVCASDEEWELHTELTGQ